MINTSTSEKVDMRISKYHDANNAFWYIAARYDSQSKEVHDAELALIDVSNCLREALRKLMEGEE
jgi:hypothetical protein